MNKFTLLILCLMAAISATHARDVIIPGPVPPGGRIALITPSSAQDSASIIRGMEVIESWGFEPVVYPHTFGKTFGSYAAPHADRVADIEAAFADTTVHAILCTRGGFGATHMLPMLDTALIRNNPKWLIGYSDVSALHALMRTAGVASIHGPMTGHMAEVAADDRALTMLRKILSDGARISYTEPADSLNNPGCATGRLYGGNFIVLKGLAQTPYDLFASAFDDNTILFIEEVSEPIHAVERMLLYLHQSGILNHVKGLIIGKFTDYEPNGDYQTMEQMFHTNLERWGYLREGFPVVFGFPVGHVTDNMPLIEGAECRLTATPSYVSLEFLP